MVRPSARRESAWGDLVTTAPPSTSPWAVRYLETLWTLKWAPNSSGRARRGVANVLSTTSAAPAWLAMAATESISATRSNGLEMLSMTLNPARARPPRLWWGGRGGNFFPARPGREWKALPEKSGPRWVGPPGAEGGGGGRRGEK